MKRRTSPIWYLVAVALAVMVVATIDAHAGTYRNDSNGTIYVPDKRGNLTPVAPGKTIETYLVLSDPDKYAGMTLIDPAPYYKPISARHDVSSTGVGDDQTVDLSELSADWLLIHKVDGGTISVFYESTSNTPPVAILRPGDVYRHDTRGRVDQIVLQFSATGTCEVLETKEALE